MREKLLQCNRELLQCYSQPLKQLLLLQSENIKQKTYGHLESTIRNMKQSITTTSKTEEMKQLKP